MWLNLVVLAVAISLSIYTERVLLRLFKSSSVVKFAIRWGYVNSILFALSTFHPTLKWLHTAYVLITGIVVLFVADSIRQKAELEDDLRRRKQHEAELEAKRIEKAKLKAYFKRVEAVRSGACPSGFCCAQMGLTANGCENRDICSRLPGAINV